MELEEVRLGIKLDCPCSDGLRTSLMSFHDELLQHCNHPPPEEEEEAEGQEKVKEKPMSWSEKLLALVARVEEAHEQEHSDNQPGGSSHLVS